MGKITVQFNVYIEQAEALAQIVKRAGFSDCLALAVNKDEAYLMQLGLNELRRGLEEAG